MDYTGQRFGDYHLTQFLAEGAVSEVYLGKHIKLNNIVAVKVLDTTIYLHDAEMDQFNKVMRSMAQLVHPHLARIRDFGVQGSLLFLVMDYLPYENLRQRHPQGVQLPLTTVVEYVKQVAAALQYAHDHKIVHRGVRPGKMLLAEDNSILLSFPTLIFPISEEFMYRQSEEQILESFCYLAPEQIKGESGPASDQYALGTVVYEWLCGEPPFQDSDTSEIMRQHEYSPPPSLREKVPTISPAVEGVVMTALAKEPQHRFATIEQFARALEQASRPKSRKPEQLARLGQRFGRYRLIQFLGEGSFGDVYLAEHVRKDSKVAIKILKTHLSQDELKQFINEARTVLLEHPHIIRLLDFGVESDDTPFLVMDHAPNGTLRERHPKGVPLPLSTIVSYVLQIAAALQYAHDQELIHRDLKPENLLLGPDNKVLLSDFGIAIIRHGTDSWVQQNIAGTAPYMAPEQFSAHAVPASDQYSLGVIVYEWLCGTRPFTTGDIGYHHNHTPPPPLHEKVPTISLEVEQVVMQALAKDPEQRFRSVQEFAEALEQACQAKRGISNLAERYPETLRALDEAIQLDPNAADTRLMRARSLYELGRYEEALLEIEEALQQFSGDSVYFALDHLMRGLILERLKQYKEAISALDEASRLIPGPSTWKTVTALDLRKNDIFWKTFVATRNLRENILLKHAPYGRHQRVVGLSVLPNGEPGEPRYATYPVKPPVDRPIGYKSRLPVFMLLDCSKSMSGDPIIAATEGIAMIHRELMNDPQALETVYISIITFSDIATEYGLTPIDAFSAPIFQSILQVRGKGERATGAALKLLVESIWRDLVLSTPTQHGDFRPLVLLLTSDSPTDPYQGAITRLKLLQGNYKPTIVALVCGSADKTTMMHELTENVYLMSQVTPATMRSFFRWLE